ncbi:MAG: alanine racemase [Pseudomonadota bacterium]
MNLSAQPDPALITPCLLLECGRMQRNIDRFSQRMHALGVALRPHIKTAKSIDVVRKMIAPQPGYSGLTVSTLAEADYCFANGMNDLLYAVVIAPGKLTAVAQRLQQGMQLSLVLDNLASARQVVDAGKRLNVNFRILIEIDADGQRAGVRADDPDLIEIAQRLDTNHSTLAGVMTHMGGSYQCRNRPCLIEAAAAEHAAVIGACDRLTQAGFDCPIVSLGSTPSARFAEDMSDVTEVRIGTYVFMDLVMAGLGVCALDDIAISVLTEVIGHRSRRGELLIDAGWMALSRDRGTAKHAVDQGYGLVCDAQGQVLNDLIVRSADQEHGIVADRNGRPVSFGQFPIGCRLRILPNHACATAAQHSGYWLLNEPSTSAKWWPRMAGWA